MACVRTYAADRPLKNKNTNETHSKLCSYGGANAVLEGDTAVLEGPKAVLEGPKAFFLLF